MCCLMRLVGTHVSWNPQIYTEWSHQLDHCHPGKLNIMYLRTNSSISRAEATTCTLPSPLWWQRLTNRSPVMIWPLEIYHSWSEDAPWLSAVGCVQDLYMHKASPCLGEVVHILLHTSSTFWTLSTETHTNTSSSSILVNGTKDSMVTRCGKFYKRNWGG